VIELLCPGGEAGVRKTVTSVHAPTPRWRVGHSILELRVNGELAAMTEANRLLHFFP
jgi:hypothetical protein